MISRRIAGKETKPFTYHDKEMTMIGRGAAVVQMLGGRTMMGARQAAWGAVRRAKAVFDWAGSALTHQRVGRITVDSDW